jgi:YqxM protein
MGIQLFLTCYLLILSIGYFTSNTGAYFNDHSNVTGVIQVANWDNEWDKSSLKFPNVTDQKIESCEATEISVVIMNKGSDMKGPSQYEVYYSEKGNPKKGEKIGEGIINPILANKESILKFIVEKPGSYKFRAFQRPNHAFKAERQDLWSETVIVTCIKNKDQNTKNNNLIDQQTPESIQKDQGKIQQLNKSSSQNKEQPTELNDSDNGQIKDTIQSKNEQTDNAETNPNQSTSSENLAETEKTNT